MVKNLEQGYIIRAWNYLDCFHLCVRQENEFWHCQGKITPDWVINETSEIPYRKINTGTLVGGTVLGSWFSDDKLGLSVSSGNMVASLSGILACSKIPDIRDDFQWLSWIYNQMHVE